MNKMKTIIHNHDDRSAYLKKVSCLSPPSRKIIFAWLNGQGLQQFLLAQGASCTQYPLEDLLDDSLQRGYDFLCDPREHSRIPFRMLVSHLSRGPSVLIRTYA